MSDVLKARVNLISHLEAQGDRKGIRLACAAFDAMDYFEGMASEEIRNYKRLAEDLTRPRGIVGERFLIVWSGGELSLLRKNIT
jgi:hypothetical protein